MVTVNQAFLDAALENHDVRDACGVKLENVVIGEDFAVYGEGFCLEFRHPHASSPEIAWLTVKGDLQAAWPLLELLKGE